MLYTGHGDAGYTTIIGGNALRKDDVRLETLGAIDEAQAHLGLARALLLDTVWASSLYRIQSELRLVMAEIATPTHGTTGNLYVVSDHLGQLEADLQAWEALTGGFCGFAVPGSSLHNAYLHLARTVIRRAERHAVALHADGRLVNPLVLTYLNRLSSWAYALALAIDFSETEHAAA